ncbi:MAG: prepilin-type N-terminal cleavage/methylation domain-containing protein [Agathobacter sp.]|nr:prepilin-type N-terminal cleavage/methylation domain-containing protein [Agathobacter sp.]
MRNHIRCKLRDNRAFTLQEILIAMAITVILFAVSFLSISNWNKSLKMTEVDKYSKIIYLEAQYQLSAKGIEGDLTQFYEKMQADYSHRFLTVMPQDYKLDEKGDGWQQLCYLVKGDPILDEMFDKNANISTIPGNYLIELNPQTGDIYGVFYWESEVQISYANQISNLLNRSRAERMSDMLGYFGGDADTSVSTAFALNQQVSVINEEELYVKVSYEDSPRLSRYYGEALSITCTITDEQGTTVTFTEDDFVINHGERFDFYLLLDSMEEGYSFKEITGGVLNEGDNLSIQVASHFKHGSDDCVEDSAVMHTNSLFANVSDAQSQKVVQISAIRHLRNLNDTYFQADSRQSYSIKLVEDIDFKEKEYAWAAGVYVGKGSTESPVASLTPMKNTNLFVNTGGTDSTIIDGLNHKLKNLVIIGTDGTVGLFSEAQNVSFTNIFVEDIKVDGGDRHVVGGLVGKATACSISNCGIYLSTTDGSKHYALTNTEDNNYNNEMERRYDQLCVMGGEYIGGVAGTISNSTVTNSFAAVKVDGTSNVGGFAGKADNTTFTNCYASGDVYAGTNTGGGMIGQADDITATNCYTTGNLYVAASAGGFVGKSSNSQYTNCNVYGEILNLDGTGVSLQGGGFVSNSYSNDVFTNCKYLQQESYNDSGLSNPATIIKQGYTPFLASGDDKISTGMSHSYAASLIYSAFPFQSVTGSHYGNWPSQYRINTSLVYYEVYKDGTYGYYCVTTLTDEAAEGDNTIWVLDTLKDMECVEDGYALLSMYNLASFKYNLYIGSVATPDAEHTGVTLNVVDVYSTNYEKEAVRLRQQGALVFNGYSEQRENYDGMTPTDYFVADGMYLYQLPYGLQCTERSNVDNFYDRFVVYNGLPKTSTGVGTTPVVGGSTVEDGVSFFYCPHFAKTAVNPNIDVDENEGDGDATNVTLKNPSYVYVRSARHLNALGRNNYYWNKRGGYLGALNYVQEININFGTYNKTYCGQNFDLMDMNASYRNVPIGEPANVNSASQFRHSYDGQGNQIIDFCVKSSNQFVGLFGEIETATIKNIHMTVSEEGKGQIICNFRTGSEGLKAGVGGLIGLSYMNQNTVENCTVSGYTVSFELSSANNNKQFWGVAMGGLVGFNMSDITNCSAENDVVLKVTAGFQTAQPVFMGGLAGSSFFGTLSDSYAGGTINISNSGNYNLGDKVAIGGVCPGYFYTWFKSKESDEAELTGDYFTNSDWKGTYKNLYSYTTILASASHYNYLMGSVGALAIADSYADKSNHVNAAIFSMDNCYYVTDGFEGKTIHSKDKSEDALTVEELANLTFTNSGKAHATNSFPVNTELIGTAYPFPAFVKNADGEFVHYGDWPAEGIEEGGGTEEPGDTEEPGGTEEPVEPEEPEEPERSDYYHPDLGNNNYVGVFYYELYEDGTYGIYAEGYHSGLSTGGNAIELINTLGATSESVQERGYGVFYKTSNYWGVSTRRNSRNYTDIDEYGTAMNIEDDNLWGYDFRKVSVGGGATDYTLYLKYSFWGSRTYTVTIETDEIANARP